MLVIFPLRRAVPALALLTFVLMFCCADASAETRDGRTPGFRFDFGPPDSELMPGFTLVGHAHTYEPSRGYGWEGTAPNAIAFEKPDGPVPPHQRSTAAVYAYDASPLQRDAVISTEDIAFRVDLPNGTYRVTLTIGNLRDHIGSIDVYLNGKLAAEHVAAFVPQFRQMLTRSLGWWNEVRRTVEVRDGVLRIRLSGNQAYYDSEVKRQDVEERAWAKQFPEGRLNYLESPFVYCGFPFEHNALMALEIVPHRPAPVSPDNDLLSLAQPIRSPALSRAIDLFNKKRFRVAQAALNEAHEDQAQVAKAIVQLWLVGRLEVEDFTPLLQSALQILRSYCAAHPEENGVAEILEDAETFAKAHEIHVNRGQYPFGESHFGQNARAIGHWWLIPEDSPVYYRAQLFIARAAHMLLPYLPTSGTERDIFQKLERKFPDNRFVRYQLYQKWDSFGDGSNYYDWVWKDYDTPVENSPAWARALYPAFQHFVDWCEWWIQHRQDERGSLGGGWGDDVEIIGAMAYNGFASPDVSPLLANGTQRFLDGLWNNSEIDPELGFYQPLWDAEHAAEWTGNTLGMAAQIDYGNPIWFERCLKTAKLMRDLWTDYDNQGLRHFRGNYYGAATVGEEPHETNDSWINFRAVRPASAVLWYNQNPTVARLMTELADAWLAAAMSTERNKPRGVLPQIVAFPEATLGGHESPNWFDLSPHGRDAVNIAWVEQGYKVYVYDLLMTAHALTNDKKYLEPLRLEYELAAKYGNVTSNKSAARLQAIPGEKRTAPRKRGADAKSKHEPGSEPWVAEHLESVNGWLVAQRRLEGRKGKLENDVIVDDVIRYGRHSTDELRRLYPLFTTEAGPTDRIGFSGCMNPYMIYTGGRFGGPMIESAVTYRNTTRQFVAAVLGTDSQGLRLLYYSLAPEARTISLVPWDLEPGGRYVLRYGPDAADDQQLRSVIEEREFDFPQRGTEIALRVEPRTAYIVEIEQLKRGGLPALAPDPALAASDIRYSPLARQILARIHNIGSQPVRHVAVAAYDGNPATGGKLIGAATIPNIEAPIDLEPRTTTIGIPWKPTDETHEIYIVIDPERKISSEITTFNNQAHTTVKKQPRETKLSAN